MNFNSHLKLLKNEINHRIQVKINREELARNLYKDDLAIIQQCPSNGYGLESNSFPLTLRLKERGQFFIHNRVSKKKNLIGDYEVLNKALLQID